MKTLLAVMMVLLLSTLALTGAWMTDIAKASRLRHDSESSLNSEGAISIGGVMPPAAFSIDALKDRIGERATAAAIAGVQWLKNPAVFEGMRLWPAWAGMRAAPARRPGRRSIASAPAKAGKTPDPAPRPGVISFTATR